ncbi:hypothetical protein QJS66_02815 [Kocuria rhizophila]|nr:hypothetical protein QJS66_02815 [Kocuria rhizophila]
MIYVGKAKNLRNRLVLVLRAAAPARSQDPCHGHHGRRGAGTVVGSESSPQLEYTWSSSSPCGSTSPTGTTSPIRTSRSPCPRTRRAPW